MDELIRCEEVKKRKGERAKKREEQRIGNKIGPVHQNLEMALPLIELIKAWCEEIHQRIL